MLSIFENGVKTMEYYKVLLQRDIEKYDFTAELKGKNIKYFTGNKRGSLAIIYNPEKYNRFLKDDNVFEKYQLSSIKQLILTNQKFEFLNKTNNLKFLKLSDFKIDEEYEDIKKEIWELEELNINEKINILINEYEVSIKEYIYRTHEQKRMVKILKNGVVGVDQEIIKNELSIVKHLIDILNYGNEATL